MDLESTNGTFINKDKIEPSRYYELKHSDLINFGQSARDYVILNASLNKLSNN
jgi:smad nuclear-interacting protein 1